ncbi:MAG: hypothetical protein ACOYJC_05870 [Christensenellales bacterium]
MRPPRAGTNSENGVIRPWGKAICMASRSHFRALSYRSMQRQATAHISRR